MMMRLYIWNKIMGRITKNIETTQKHGLSEMWRKEQNTQVEFANILHSFMHVVDVTTLLTSLVNESYLY